MNTALLSEHEVDVDFIEEIRLRTWARQNYLPREQRNKSLHPVILDEMKLKDQEDRHQH